MFLLLSHECQPPCHRLALAIKGGDLASPPRPSSSCCLLSFVNMPINSAQPIKHHDE